MSFWSKISTDQSGINISVKKAEVHVNGRENQLFSRLFYIMDCNVDNKVSGKEAAQILRRSNLTNDILGTIWNMCHIGKDKSSLTRTEWCLACKLVACAQQGGEVKISSIANYEFDIPIFDLGIETQPRETIAFEPLPEPIVATIGKSITVGSLVNKHTEYEIIVTTKMDNFPGKNFEVCRRYSDFEWLHKRLSMRYPSRVIPPIPEKKQRGKFASDFVEGRRLALAQFLFEITHDEEFACTYEFQIFFSTTQAGMEAARALMATGDVSIVRRVADTALGKMNRASLAGGSGDVMNMSGEFGDVEMFLHQYGEHLHKSASAGGKMVAAESQISEDFQAMSDVFHKLTDTAVSVDDDDATEFFTVVGDGLEKLSSSMSKDSTMKHEGLVTDMRMLHGRVGSLRAVIHNRDRSKKEIAKAEQAEIKARQAISAAKSVKDKVAYKAGKVALEKSLQDYSSRVNVSAKVLQGVKDGVAVLYKERATMVATAFAKYAAERVVFCQDIQNLSANLINQADYTAKEILESNLRLKGYKEDDAAYVARISEMDPVEVSSPVIEDSENEEEFPKTPKGKKNAAIPSSPLPSTPGPGLSPRPGAPPSSVADASKASTDSKATKDSKADPKNKGKPSAKEKTAPPPTKGKAAPPTKGKGKPTKKVVESDDDDDSMKLSDSDSMSEGAESGPASDSYPEPEEVSHDMSDDDDNDLSDDDDVDLSDDDDDNSKFKMKLPAAIMKGGKQAKSAPPKKSPPPKKEPAKKEPSKKETAKKSAPASKSKPSGGSGKKKAPVSKNDSDSDMESEKEDSSSSEYQL